MNIMISASTTDRLSIDAIISALEYNHGKFPRNALLQAIGEKESVAPRLLQVIRDATENIQKIDADEAYMLHIYSLYLLAQFRDTEAYSLIVEFFSTPGEITLQVTGDIVTEDLGRILASTYNGDLRPLERMIEDRNINEYVRTAALQALCILWGYERISRQQILQYYHYLFSEALVGEISYVWTALVANSLKLSPDELADDVDKAFEQGLVESFFVGREDFDKSLGLSNEDALRKFKVDGRYSLIENTISEMERWACFQSDKERKPNPAGLNSRRDNPKTGRNDPCPCGSGKKYKKCCLRA